MSHLCSPKLAPFVLLIFATCCVAFSQLQWDIVLFYTVCILTLKQEGEPGEQDTLCAAMTRHTGDGKGSYRPLQAMDGGTLI